MLFRELPQYRPSGLDPHSKASYNVLFPRIGKRNQLYGLLAPNPTDGDKYAFRVVTYHHHSRGGSYWVAMQPLPTGELAINLDCAPDGTLLVQGSRGSLFRHSPGAVMPEKLDTPWIALKEMEQVDAFSVASASKILYYRANSATPHIRRYFGSGLTNWANFSTVSANTLTDLRWFDVGADGTLAALKKGNQLITAGLGIDSWDEEAVPLMQSFTRDYAQVGVGSVRSIFLIRNDEAALYQYLGTQKGVRHPLQKISTNSDGQQVATTFAEGELVAASISEYGIVLSTVQPESAGKFDSLPQHKKDALKPQGITDQMSYDLSYGTVGCWINVREPGTQVDAVEKATHVVL